MASSCVLTELHKQQPGLESICYYNPVLLFFMFILHILTNHFEYEGIFCHIISAVYNYTW